LIGKTGEDLGARDHFLAARPTCAAQPSDRNFTREDLAALI